MSKTKNEDIERALLKITATEESLNEIMILIRDLKINLSNLKKEILVIIVDNIMEEQRT